MNTVQWRTGAAARNMREIERIVRDSVDGDDGNSVDGDDGSHGKRPAYHGPPIHPQ